MANNLTQNPIFIDATGDTTVSLTDKFIVQAIVWSSAIGDSIASDDDCIITDGKVNKFWQARGFLPSTGGLQEYFSITFPIPRSIKGMIVTLDGGELLIYLA